MRINIKPENCKFVINPEERKVVCIYEGTAYDAIDYITDHISNIVMLTSKTQRLQMPGRFVGIATCSEGDNWNEEFGRKVAFTKMRKKYYTSFFKRLNFFIDYVDKHIATFVEDTNKFGDKVGYNIANETEYIENYLKEHN